MAKALSVDLRDRVVAAIEGGSSRRQAAARFGVSVSSAIRWRARERATGDVSPGPQGGDRRSDRIEARASLILGLVDETPDITLAEIQAVLAEHGVGASISTVWRFFDRRGITFKKRPFRPPSRSVPTS